MAWMDTLLVVDEKLYVAMLRSSEGTDASSPPPPGGALFISTSLILYPEAGVTVKVSPSL